MKPFAAGLLAAGLLAVNGWAAGDSARPDEVAVGVEWLVRAPEEVALRDADAGWVLGSAASFQPSAASPLQRTSALSTAHPVFSLAGTEPSVQTRRIVTGRLSVRIAEGGDSGTLKSIAIDPAAVAADHGLTDEGAAEGAAPWRVFRADPPARALEAVGALRNDPRIAEVEVVLARHVAHRGLPDDPLLTSQWHLGNSAPATDGGVPVDLAVEAAWGTFNGVGSGWRGRGVRLGIIDDGIEYAHPEFANSQLDVAAGRNWNGGVADLASAQGPADKHGTAVAGLAAAAADNALGGAGVAPAAGLVSLRLTAGAHDDVQEAQALSYLANARAGSNSAGLIHVKNASWGPADGVFRLAGPGPLARQALVSATRDGRGGRGSVFVWAAGNGGAPGEDANADGYANNPYVIAVGAMDSHGRVPDYSEGGACLAVVAPSHSENGLPIVTTDRMGATGFNPPTVGTDLPDEAFTLAFGGTSAAAPQVAGVCALMLEANPSLGWRDVKEILLRTARRVNPSSPAWITNAVGLRFHPRQGAGLVDAAAATTMAANWTPLGSAIEVRANAMQPGAIPDGDDDGLVRTFAVGQRRRVEHALLRFSANHPYRGDLKITLTSPGGTTSVLAPSYFTASPSGQSNYDQWVFSSLHFWGEPSHGTWTLRVADVLPEESGRFLGAELTLLASATLAAPVFTSPPVRTAAVGESFTHVVAAANGPVAIIAVGELPPGLVFDAAGILRGRPSTAGKFSLSFRGTSATGTTTQSFELSVVSQYQHWVTEQGVPEGLSGPAEDADGDGWPNVVEYAARGLALVPDTPDLGRCTVALNEAPSFVFHRYSSGSDVTWQVEHSLDGAAWTVVAESQKGQPVASLDPARFLVAESDQPAGAVQVTITDTALPRPRHGWFRLRIGIEM